MSSENLSFVDVRQANVDYSEHSNVLRSLVGRKPATRSVLRNINVRMNQGDHAVLYGAPASGKSTFLRMLTGVLRPSSGSVHVNGAAPAEQRSLAAGYVSAEETEPQTDTVNEILHAFGRTHGVDHLPSRIGHTVEVLGISNILERSAEELSSTQRLLVNIARAAISDTPLILLDGIADRLGAKTTHRIITELFDTRTIIVTTTFPDTAQQLEMPIMLLHDATLAHYGTCDAIAKNIGCPRVVDVWIEGLRYDLLRRLREHAGVAEVRLMSSDQFDGQRLRITLLSSRYLPAMYDVVSQADLVKIEELPPSLSEILEQL